MSDQETVDPVFCFGQFENFLHASLCEQSQLTFGGISFVENKNKPVSRLKKIKGILGIVKMRGTGFGFHRNVFTGPFQNIEKRHSMTGCQIGNYKLALFYICLKTCAGCTFRMFNRPEPLSKELSFLRKIIDAKFSRFICAINIGMPPRGREQRCDNVPLRKFQ